MAGVLTFLLLAWAPVSALLALLIGAAQRLRNERAPR